MIISHSEKFIFIHNYKVAGSSITNSLTKYDSKFFLRLSFSNKIGFLQNRYPKINSSQFATHITAIDLKKSLPPMIFDSYYKFGFIRNPWDWQVSLYTYMLGNKNHHQHKLAKSFRDFDEYVEWRINKDLHLQKDFFYNGDDCLVDFIGRYENLNADFNSVLNKIGINSSLSHINKSIRNSNYIDYYSQKSIDMIFEAFIQDIQLFGYAKPGLK